MLIFQKEGRFQLDSAREQSEDPATFITMDETVSFLIGHDLKVNGEEIPLQNILPCDDEHRYRLSSNGRSTFTLQLLHCHYLYDVYSCSQRH